MTIMWRWRYVMKGKMMGDDDGVSGDGLSLMG